VIVDWLIHRTARPETPPEVLSVVLPWVQALARAFLPRHSLSSANDLSVFDRRFLAYSCSSQRQCSHITSRPASNLYGSQVECSACSAQQPRASESSCALPQSTMTAGSGRGGVSPSSSPRLPSPPPFTEVQIGPKSPTIGDSNNNPQLGDALRADDGALRRIRPGTKASEMASGPPMVEIHEVRMAVSCTNNQCSSTL
jgi:hypothetical protein